MRRLIPLPIFILLLVFLAACGSSKSATEDVACALTELPYPRPEPAYSGKLNRDLGPFSAALSAYSPEQIAAREALVSGKTIPEIQTFMHSGDLTAVGLVVLLP